MQVDNSTGSEFSQFYNLSNFIPSSLLDLGGSSIFGNTSLLVIVDLLNKVQTNDEKSAIEINCDQSVLNPNATFARVPKCLMENGTTFSVLTMNFKQGMVELPKILIHSLPNSSVHINIKVTFVNTVPATTSRKELLFKIDMVNCSSDQIIDSTGLCQYCSGPDFFKQVPGPSSSPADVQV